MWGDLSFDVRSFSPDSFGPSWGLTWEAAQELDEYTDSGGNDGKGKAKTRSAMREATPSYPWYAKDRNKQESGNIPVDSNAIAENVNGYDGIGGTTAPEKKQEESASSKSKQILAQVDQASNSILLAKKTLSQIANASALAIRQRKEDEEAAMLMAFLVLSDDD